MIHEITKLKHQVVKLKEDCSSTCPNLKRDIDELLQLVGWMEREADKSIDDMGGKGMIEILVWGSRFRLVVIMIEQGLWTRRIKAKSKSWLIARTVGLTEQLRKIEEKIQRYEQL